MTRVKSNVIDLGIPGAALPDAEAEINLPAPREADEPEIIECAPGRNFEFTEEDREAAASLGIDLERAPAACIDRAVSRINKLAAESLEAGYLLIKAKAELPHGEFDKHAAARGIDKFRAAEFMRLAKFYSAQDEEGRRKVFILGKKKLLALASADPEVVEALLEDGDARDLSALSVRQLRDELKKTRSALENSNVRLAAAESNLEVLALAAAQKPRPSPYSAETQSRRLESQAIIDAVDVQLALLLADFEAEKPKIAAPEAEERFRALWWAAQTVAARACQAMWRIQAGALFNLPEEISMADLLTPEEAERANQNAKVIRDGAQAQRNVAKLDRDGDPAFAPRRGRGRPRKEAK
jgi:hypothetical protein